MKLHVKGDIQSRSSPETAPKAKPGLTFPATSAVADNTRMEFSLSGNALKTFARCITCLARIGNEVTLQASPSQLALHSLNSSRSAYQSVTLKPAFFDVYTIAGAQVQCSMLLKAICAVLRTPLTSIDHMSVLLPDPDASKVQWTLDCNNGMKKSYWITCNVEPDVQHLSLDRRRLPSSFVVRPRDLNRLLANFQSTLQEITVIATETTALPSDAANEVGGKAVELRSYIDPSKENDSSLHTQLWIDPCEEFVQYTHSGDPVDVTFGVKELKAFLSFCEGCEVDIHLYFDKAGGPILMAPKFGLEDASVSNFDATLVLATMLVSQLHDRRTSTEPTHAAPATHGTEDQPQERPKGNESDHPDHTRIWSELSASATKSATGPPQERERDLNTNGYGDIQRISTIHISKAREDGRNLATNTAMQSEHVEEAQEINGHGTVSQRHLSNWVDADEDDEEADDSEPYVQATPPYCEEQ